VALLAAAVGLGDHLHAQPHQRAHVGGQGAVGSGDQHGIHGGGQAHDDLLHARVARTCIGVQLAQQGDLVGVGQAFHRVDRRVELARAVQRQRLAGALPFPRDGARGLRGVQQLRQHDLVGVGEAGLLAADRAHAHTLLDGVAAVLDDALFQHPRLAA
jgi:hypothetical protein